MTGGTERRRRLLPLTALLALVVVAAALYTSLRGVVAVTGLIEDLRAERLRPERVLILLGGAENAERGYLLTQRREDLAALEQARRELPPLLDEIAGSDPGGGREHGLVVEVRELVARRLASIDLTIDLVDERGPAAALAAVQADSGSAIMDRARAAVGDLRDAEEQRMATQIGAVERRIGLATIFVALSSIVLAMTLAALLRARRQEARDQLAEEERSRRVATELARISELVEGLPAVIASVRVSDMVVEVANARMRLLTGPVDGRPVAEALPPAAAERFIARIGGVVASGEAFEGKAIASVDGRERWDVALLPLRGDGGAVERVIVFAQDVTAAEQARADVERARQELVESERRLSALVAGTRQVVFTSDPEGRLTDSAGWRAFTGLSDADMRRDALAPVHARDRQRVESAWRESLKTRRPFAQEFRTRRADGREVWLAAEAVPVIDDGGGVREWIGTAVDISDAKQAEALRELFFGMLGHDLRAPVSAIRTGAELALRRGLPENQARVVGRILTSTDRMSRMIDQALDFARARLGSGIPLTRVPMDLGESVARIVSEHEMAHATRQIAVTSTGRLDGIWDDARLGQVVANLLGNAHRYGPPDVPIRVDVSGEADREVRLVVQNDGPPIDSDLLAILFEPFRRGTHGKSGGEEGLGLGLYITQQIVLAHGGTITVTSTASEGTRFEVTLPRG